MLRGRPGVEQEALQARDVARVRATLVAATSGVYPSFGPIFYLELFAGDCSKAVSLLKQDADRWQEGGE